MLNSKKSDNIYQFICNLIWIFEELLQQPLYHIIVLSTRLSLDSKLMIFRESEYICIWMGWCHSEYLYFTTTTHGYALVFLWILYQCVYASVCKSYTRTIRALLILLCMKYDEDHLDIAIIYLSANRLQSMHSIQSVIFIFCIKEISVISFYSYACIYKPKQGKYYQIIE